MSILNSEYTRLATELSSSHEYSQMSSIKNPKQQTDRQMDRQTDRRTNEQTGRHRQTNRDTGTDRQTHSLEGDEDFAGLEFEGDLGESALLLGTPTPPPRHHEGSPFWFFSTSHSSSTSIRCSPISRQRLLNLLPSRMHSCKDPPRVY